MSDVVQYIGNNVKLGKNVMKWHFTYIGNDSEIGDNTKIGSLVHIDYNVKIGKDCKIEGMAYIPPMTRIGDRVFVGPGARAMCHRVSSCEAYAWLSAGTSRVK